MSQEVIPRVWDLQEEELMGFADGMGGNQGTVCQPVGPGGKW